MTSYKFLVFTDAVEGKEEEYNNWYDNVHLKDVTACDGFVAATRYQFKALDGETPPRRFLAIYDIESDDVLSTMKNMMDRALAGGMQMSDALAPDPVTYLFEAMPASGGEN